MGNDYAIVIGIDSYAKMQDDSAFSPLTSAVRDAARFREWLLSADGGALDDSRIVTISSPPVINNQLPLPIEAKPIKDQIDDALSDFGFSNDKRIGDRFYFYFSGHGIGLGSTDVALMMANAVRKMENRNISLKYYREYMQERDLFSEIIFIVDCCRSRDTKPIDPGKPVFIVPPAVPQPKVQDLAILAAEYGEPSFAITGGQGLLTTALLEGLSGAPEATDQKGRVTSNTLNNFIPKRVESLAKKNLLAQHPEVDAFPNRGEIILCKPRKKVRVKIIADASVKGDLVVCDGENQELFRREAKLATPDSPWEVELFDSFVPYSVRVGTFNNPIMLKLEVVKENNNVFQVP